MGRARGGITLEGGTWDATGKARDEFRDADEVLLEVLERGGAFPTYPHCTEADQLVACVNCAICGLTRLGCVLTHSMADRDGGGRRGMSDSTEHEPEIYVPESAPG